ncbi:MAG: hypothetical protein HDR24_10945 [Lachnospiraceae bacterium]|nr:hypothetical protein [Lachnospiraceae bacterium]
MQLNNADIVLKLNDYGNIKEITLLRYNKSVLLEDDEVRAVSDLGDFSSGNIYPAVLKTGIREMELLYEMPRCTYKLLYRLPEEGAYFERYLSVIPSELMTLYRVETEVCFREWPLETVDYHTFWNCPTAVFVRFEDFGVYSGFANPFFQMTAKKGRMKIEFEPSMQVNPEEQWISDSNFWGIHRLSGEKIREQLPKTSIRYNGVDHPRYHNPSGFIALDKWEIKSFKRFADEYLEPRTKNFKIIFYTFFCPLPQQPETEEEEQLYYHYIDNFAAMGGEIITFNPLVRNRPPLPDKDSYWELAPKGSVAERILNYTKAKGMKIGFYMGSAPDNSYYCNSPMVEFASTREKADWKKIGIGGEVSRENCIGNDDFAEWFFEVQKNTIEKYDITLWDWDPGPGNGFFCYSTRHGHLPGKGNYKGFRNAMNLVQRLREYFPELYIQGFHGTKEYGLWGFKGFDQHEAYWEQCPYDGATIYPDLSEDRLTASGMRFQSWWNQNFRFMPALTNHSLGHRMMQWCDFPRELLYLFDHLGWKYGIMSALAAGASITVPIIPYNPEDVFGEYISFFRKWTQWGKEHFVYNQHAIAFGSQVVCGTVDGYSKILEDHGFLFLCNAAPVPCEICFALDEDIGLVVPGSYGMKQIYPLENIKVYDGKTGKGVWGFGDKVHVTVPQYEVLVLELYRTEEKEEALYGINGVVTIEDECVEITGSTAPEGCVLNGNLKYKDGIKIKQLRVNGTALPFIKNMHGLDFQVQYGKKLLPRYFYHWIDLSGNQVECPNRQALDKVMLSTDFVAHEEIRVLLEKARPANAEQVEELVPLLAKKLNRRNFAWAMPYRLFLVIPFSDAALVEGLRIWINGEELSYTHVTVGKGRTLIDYLDITDVVKWGEKNKITIMATRLPEKHFLGAYLYYPPCSETDFATIPNYLPDEVSVQEPLYQISDLKPWYEKEGRRVMIDAAWIRESVIREMHDYTVCASVNLPPDELEGVYFSAQICIDQTYGTLDADDMMEYDSVQKVWKKVLHMGSRQLLIIDGEAIYVWAVTKDHYVSPAYKLKLEWQLY